MSSTLEPPATSTADTVVEAIATAPVRDSRDRSSRVQTKEQLLQGMPQPVALGRFVLLAPLGAGGVGIVYSAYDPSLDRRVAIKLLQAGGGNVSKSDRAGERLLREAQAIARLSHPNIVAVHDVGAYGDEVARSLPGIESSGVYIVMEQLAGVGLGKWMRARKRPWREVLAVFLEAGRGLEAAHRAGLVHRDFKPSNVIVDDDGRVRVLDFGLARISGSSEVRSPPTEGERDEDDSLLASPLTRTGHVLGTPSYMAPEQHRGVSADPGCDQYAFCVTLFEALHGRRPFEGRTSADLVRAKLAGAITTSTDRSVPGALGRVIARGLRAEPHERWPSMTALLGALETVGRRRRRFGLGLVGATASLGLLAIAWQGRVDDACGGFDVMLEGVWDGETRAAVEAGFAASTRPFANDSWTATAAGLDAYAAEWSQRRRAACESTLVRRERDAEAMNRSVLCLDRGLARARELVTMLRDPDDDLVVRAPEAVDALPSLAACEHLGVTAPATDDAGGVEADDDAIARIEALRSAARYEEARAAADELVAGTRSTEQVGRHARALLALGRVARDQSDRDIGEQALHAAIVAAERSGDEASAAEALLLLAAAHVEAAEPVHAERDLRIAEAKIDRHALGGSLEIELWQGIMGLRRLQGDYGEAAAAAEHALEAARREHGDDHSAVARAHASLGLMLAERGDHEDALAHYALAESIYRRRLGDRHPAVATAINNRAGIESSSGRQREALALYEEALAIREDAYGPRHPLVAAALANVASERLELGEAATAAPALERVVELFGEVQGADHPDVGIALISLANARLDLGRPEEALAAADRSYEVLSRRLGADHPRTAQAIGTRGIALLACGRADDAVIALEQAREVLRQRVGERGMDMAMVSKALGEARWSAGDSAGAIADLTRALELLERGGADPTQIERTRRQIARVRGGEPPPGQTPAGDP